MKKFEDILTSLNEKQLQAVETIYWPVLVIAWPGSGKTQLLAARIANILNTTDYLPSNILCLTFTENAAKNMRERLSGMIWQDAYKVAIHTFHSFGSEIIGRFRYLTQEYNDAKPVDTIESSRILDSILEWLNWDNPYKPGYRASDTIKEVLWNINNLKKWGITPEYYETIISLNIETIKKINPIIGEYWSQIDSLWQKKEEKEKKIEIFKIFTEKVQQLSDNEKNIGNYERLETIIIRSLNEAWENYEGDTSTKFMNAWRDSWTQKNYKNIRELKETSKTDKQIALASIFKEYQSILKEKWLIDFSDMILEAISLVEKNDIVKLSLAETYQFIMVDEFQDTNEAQMRLINNILSANIENPNIFAVGDDDQSIYKFQWANTKNIRDFHDTYHDTELIILEKNYRSKQEIISSSRTVIKSEMNDIGNIFDWAVKKFEAVRENGGTVRKLFFKNELEEISWIIDDIKEKIDTWENPKDTAIITKKNKTLELIAKWLLEKWVSVTVSKNESLFDNEIIILIVQILRFIDSLDGAYQEENAELFVKILSHPCFNINRLTLWNTAKTIYHSRKDTSRSWIESLSKHEDTYLKNTANFLKELSTRSRVERLEDIIDYITGANGLSIPDDYDDDGEINQFQISMFGDEKSNYTSPLYTYYFGQLSNNNWSKILYTRHLANVRVFVEQVRNYKNGKSFLTLDDAINLIKLIEKYDLTGDITIPHIIGNEQNDVNLITVYKAQWLEWKHVYVPCIHNREYKSGKISGSSLPKNLPLEADRDNDDDIERLVYTAFTRAKDSLTMSYSKESINEKSLEPLSCLDTGDESWIQIDQLPIESITTTLEVDKKELFSLPYLGEEKDFLKDRIEKIFVMNATALQNFLNIVDAGPERFVANSLLRFPQAKNIAASYGSAIHKALEDFFTDFTKNNSYQKKILFDVFEKYVKDEWFDPKTEETYLSRGKDNLEAIYTEVTKQSYGELFLEYDFRAAHGWTFLPSEGNEAIQITGKIDRIEKLTDDSLIITDYKTGSGFDAFDGKWAEYEKIKQWKYRLQLAFYAILFELSPRWRMYKSKKYELFFVEKNRDEERFHRVMEYIQTGEVERTKNLIRAVTKCINTMDFPNITKYPKTLEGIRMFEEDLIQWNI